MRLTAEQFAHLSSTFGATAVETGKQERRRASRIELNARIRITANDATGPQEVLACDYSARGISILRDTPMSPDTQFVAHLPIKHGGQTALLCTVTSCKPEADAQHRIGAEFVCIVRPGDTGRSVDQTQTQRLRDSIFD